MPIGDYTFDIRKIPGEIRVIDGQRMQWDGQNWQQAPSLPGPGASLASQQRDRAIGGIGGKVGGALGMAAGKKGVSALVNAISPQGAIAPEAISVASQVPSMTIPGIPSSMAPNAMAPASNVLSGGGAGGAALPGAESSPGFLAANPMLQGGLGAVGLGLGAYGMKEAFEKGDPLMGGLSGAGAGAGASALAGALGLTAASGGLLAPLAIGGALLGGGLGLFGGDKERWRTEQDRYNKLIEETPGLEGMMPAALELTSGRSRDELLALEQQKAAEGLHSNVDFAQSRDVADLTPEDIWGYTAFTEKFGPQYWHGGEEARRNVAAEALERGLISERTGTIDIAEDDDFTTWAKAQLEGEGV